MSAALSPSERARRTAQKMSRSAAPLFAAPLGLMRQVVSGSKIRYVDETYDLDLTYITERIMAMGLPAESLEAAWRNSISDVATFLNDRHHHRHRVYNLCDERDYDPAPFHAVVAIPFPDHHPPTMDALLLFISDARSWLAEDPDNVIAVHCKAGKGRTGVMIAALLMDMKHPACPNADATLRFFRARRTTDGDACRNAGQVRYVHYYDRLQGEGLPPARTFRLQRLVMFRKGRRADLSAADARALNAGGRWPLSGRRPAGELTKRAGSSVMFLKLGLHGRAPTVLNSGPGQVVPYPDPLGGTARALGLQLGAVTGPALQGPAWSAMRLLAEIPLHGVEVTADVKLQLCGSGALGIVSETLWRLNFHTSFEAPVPVAGDRPAVSALDRARAARRQAQEGAPAGAAPAEEPARGPTTAYLEFTHVDLDDCKGFAAAEDFVIRIYLEVDD